MNLSTSKPDNTEAYIVYIYIKTGEKNNRKLRNKLYIVIFFYSRNRIRMYPAFVNCTTIDWFSEWPLDALLEVADKYLSEESLGSEEEVRVMALC